MARENAAVATLRSGTLQGLARLLSTTSPAPSVRVFWNMRTLGTTSAALFLGTLAVFATLQAVEQRRRTLQNATTELDMLAATLAAQLDGQKAPGLPKVSETGAALTHYAQDHKHQILLSNSKGDVTESLPKRKDIAGPLTDHLGASQPLTTFTDTAGVMRITLPSGQDVLATVRALHPPLGQVAVYQSIDDVLAGWWGTTLYSSILLFGAAGLATFGTLAWHRQTGRVLEAETQSCSMREQIETALNRGRCGLWDWDIARGRIYWSNSMFDLLGLTPERNYLSVGDLNGMIHPEDHNLTHLAERMADQRIDMLDHTFRMSTGDGGWMWLRARAELVQHSNLPARLIGIAVDITDQHMMAQRTATADTRLRDAIETISEAFVLWDADNKLVMCNSKFQKFHSLPSDAVYTGTDYATLMSRGAPPQIDCEIGLGPLQPHVADENLARSYEARLADGRWLQINERRTADGGFVSVGTDITKLKQHEEQLMDSERRLLATVADLRHSRHSLELQTKQLVELAERYLEQKAEAETASRVKSQFLSNMSHELRTPLNHIIGFSEMMEHQTLGKLGHEKYIDYCADIRESGQKLLGLISDVLEMSELESGSAGIQRAWIAGQDLLQPVFETAQGKAAERDVSIQIILPHSLPDLFVDASALRKCFDNILANAIKFSNPQGSIEVMALVDSAHLTLSVQDHGVGITLDDQQRIFKPFEQSHATMEDGYKGPGLGLAIAKSLVGLHGGTLSLTSAPGEGTRADIKLPLAPAQAGHIRTNAAAAA